MTTRVKFSSTKPRCDRRHVLTEDDVLVLLGRLPEDVRWRLRAVHFNDQSRGARQLGYVTAGHREIAICALPPRISLTRFLVRRQSPQEFGARHNAHWPELAVRRFMLYETFLHELGHLQLVSMTTKPDRLSFARERWAEAFADGWRRRLWLDPFDHADPVHNAPTAEELESLGPG